MPKVSRNPQIQPQALLNRTPGSTGSGIAEGVKAVAQSFAQLLRLPKCAQPSTHTGFLDAMNPPILPPGPASAGNTETVSLGPTPNPSAVLTQGPSQAAVASLSQERADREPETRSGFYQVSEQDQFGARINIRTFNETGKLVAEQAKPYDRLDVYNIPLNNTDALAQVLKMHPRHNLVFIRTPHIQGNNHIGMLYDSQTKTLQVQIEPHQQTTKELQKEYLRIQSAYSILFPWSIKLDLRNKHGAILAEVNLHQPHGSPEQQGKVIIYTAPGSKGQTPLSQQTQRYLKGLFPKYTYEVCTFGQQECNFNISSLTKPSPIQHA